jgi:DNA-binding Lrp family transcriptional regulator
MTKRHNRTGRTHGGERYVGLPFYMIRSSAWRSLSPAACKTFIEAAAFYRGDNNGYLALGTRILSKRIGVSKDTVSRALTELDDKGFIERTYVGTFKRKDRRASEYRLTLYNCDRDHRIASKAFMQWDKFDSLSDNSKKLPRSSRSLLSDRTVRSQRHAKEDYYSEYDHRDRQPGICTSDSPTTGTQLIYQRGTGHVGATEDEKAVHIVPTADNDGLDIPRFLDRRVGTAYGHALNSAVPSKSVEMEEK